MFFLVLAIVSLLVILLSIAVGIVVIYHFSRFGIKNDANVKRFLKIFKIGGGIIVFLNLVLLILLIV